MTFSDKIEIEIKEFVNKIENIYYFSDSNYGVEYLNNNFERGINKTIKIINGMDLVTFTITISNILCKVLLGFTPFVSDVVSKIPIGSPIIKAIIVEIKTIYMVSHKGWTIV